MFIRTPVYLALESINALSLECLLFWTFTFFLLWDDVGFRFKILVARVLSLRMRVDSRGSMLSLLSFFDKKFGFLKYQKHICLFQYGWC